MRTIRKNNKGGQGKKGRGKQRGKQARGLIVEVPELLAVGPGKAWQWWLMAAFAFDLPAGAAIALTSFGGFVLSLALRGLRPGG